MIAIRSKQTDKMSGQITPAFQKAFLLCPQEKMPTNFDGKKIFKDRNRTVLSDLQAYWLLLLQIERPSWVGPGVANGMMRKRQNFELEVLHRCEPWRSAHLSEPTLWRLVGERKARRSPQ